jgi:glycosyltransferase involved in cell wall biosynthesis
MLSVIIPVSNRQTLYATLESTKEAKEVIVVADGKCPISEEICKNFNNVKYYELMETGDYGASQRNFGMRVATQPLISFLDDDDVYVEGGVEKIISYSKLNSLNLFKVKFRNFIIWDSTEIQYGNVCTVGMVVPNNISKVGVWTARYGHDLDFAEMTFNLIGSVNFVDFILTKVRPHEQ